MRTVSRAQRRERYLQCALEMWDKFEAWYDEHPEATFGEIEERARRVRRELMGKALEVLINGRDTGHGVNPPHCERCGEEMAFHEYRGKTIRGLEGDTHLERAYYVCPNGCGETIFPPGPEVGPASGSVE
jgi:hypothetical protein